MREPDDEPPMKHRQRALARQQFVQVVGPDFLFRLGAVDPDVGGAGIAPVVQQHAKAAGGDLVRQRHEFIVRAPAARDQHHPRATVAHDLVNDIHAANVLDRHRFLHCCGGDISLPAAGRRP